MADKVFVTEEKSRGWRRAGSWGRGSNRRGAASHLCTGRSRGEPSPQWPQQQPQHAHSVESCAVSTLELPACFFPSAFWCTTEKGKIADYSGTLLSTQRLFPSASIRHAVFFSVRNTTTHVHRIIGHSRPKYISIHTNFPTSTHSFPTMGVQKFSILPYLSFYCIGFLSAPSLTSNDRHRQCLQHHGGNSSSPESCTAAV